MVVLNTHAYTYHELTASLAKMYSDSAFVAFEKQSCTFGRTSAVSALSCSTTAFFISMKDQRTEINGQIISNDTKKYLLQANLNKPI